MKISEIFLENSEVYVNPYGKSYKIYYNPNDEEFMECFNNSIYEVIRAIILDDGTLWIWDAEMALHSDIDQLGTGTENGYAFQIFHNHIDPQQSPKKELRNAMKNNATLVSLNVARMRMS